MWCGCNPKPHGEFTESSAVVPLNIKKVSILVRRKNSINKEVLKKKLCTKDKSTVLLETEGEGRLDYFIQSKRMLQLVFYKKATSDKVVISKYR